LGVKGLRCEPGEESGRGGGGGGSLKLFPGLVFFDR